MQLQPQSMQKRQVSAHGSLMPESAETLAKVFGDSIETQEMQSFQCKLSKEDDVKGFLYLTSTTVYFYSNNSNKKGQEVQAVLPLSEIKRVTKINGQGIRRKAITLITEQEEIILRDMKKRDLCYAILLDRLPENEESVKEEGSAKKKRTRTVSGKSFMKGLKSMVPAKSKENAFSADETEAAPQVPAADTTALDIVSAVAGEATASAEIAAGRVEIDPNDVDRSRSSTLVSNSTTTSAKKSRASPMTAAVKSAYGELITSSSLAHVLVKDKELDLSLKDFQELFVLDDAHFSMMEFQKSCKENVYQFGRWEDHKPLEGTDGKIMEKLREINFIKPIGIPGVPHAKGLKTQYLRSYGVVGLVVFSSTKLNDVPGSDCFLFEDAMQVIVQDDGKHGCKVSVTLSYQLNWVKWSMLKSIIESTTKGEMRIWGDTYFGYLQQVSIKPEHELKGYLTEGGYDSDPDIVQRHRQNYRDSNPGVEVAAVEENATARRSIFSSLIGGGKQARSNIGRAINSSTLKTDSKNQGDEDANAYSEISGYLHKRALYASDEGKEWKKRYFETKGNYLVYYRSHKDDKLLAALDLSTVSQIYVLKSQDLEADKPLSTTTSESMKSVMEEACDSIFVLEMSEGQKYLFKAYNNEEATVWVEVLRSIHCKAFKDYGDLDIMFNPMIGRGSGFPSRKTVRDIQSSVEASNKRWCCWPFCRSSTSADSHLQRGKRHDSEIVSIDTQMGKTLAKSVISGSKPRDGEYDENSVSSVHNNPSVDKEHSVRCCC